MGIFKYLIKCYIEDIPNRVIYIGQRVRANPKINSLHHKWDAMGILAECPVWHRRQEA